MAKKPSAAEAPASAPARTEPELLVVLNPYTLLSPFLPHNPRGGAGTVVPADDPALNTFDLSEDERKAVGVMAIDERRKLGPAPAGATVTPNRDPRIAGLYAHLGYERIPYEGARPKPPEPVASVRTEPVEPPSDDDLAVPPRDELPTS